MKKIIVAIDGLNYKPSVIELAISWSIHTNSHLVGVFLHDKTYRSYEIYDTDKGMLLSDESIEKAAAHDEQVRADAIAKFKEACSLKKIAYTVRIDINIALRELVHESLYADMLVINSGEHFNHYPTISRPSAFVKELLESVQCPVLLAPDKVQPIDKAVLLYDGSQSSVIAIKRFCDQATRYSPSLTAIEVLTIKDTGAPLHLKDYKLIKEYLKRHFPKAKFSVLAGEPRKKIAAVLKREHSGTLAVLGAYQRGMVSRWFRPSMADILLSMVRLPLFIAHTM